MFRNFAVVVGYAAILVLFTAASVPAAQFGTAEEAKAMLEKAVAAVKEDKAKALDMFNNGEGGFKDRDLYVWCANAADGILTAHPRNKGKELRDIEGKKGSPFGKEIMQKAAEGTIKEITYWGHALTPTSRWRRLPYTPRPAIRFAVSATTRNEPRGRTPNRSLGSQMNGHATSRVDGTHLSCSLAATARVPKAASPKRSTT